MANSNSSAPTVWQALDGWAATLKPWQRAIIAHAIKARELSEARINEVYGIFLQDTGLKDKQDATQITIDVTGRPADALTKKLRLEKIDNLDGINALPSLRPIRHWTTNARMTRRASPPRWHSHASSHPRVLAASHSRIHEHSITFDRRICVVSGSRLY
jgi:hypothetical protein